MCFWKLSMKAFWWLLNARACRLNTIWKLMGHDMNSMKLVIPLHAFYFIKKISNDAVTPQHQSQFTPKMKANAVPRLLSSLVWIDQYNECNGMTSFIEFMSTCPCKLLLCIHPLLSPNACKLQELALESCTLEGCTNFSSPGRVHLIIDIAIQQKCDKHLFRKVWKLSKLPS